MDLANLAESSGISEACEKLRGTDLNPDEVSALCAEYRSELEHVKNEISRQVSGQVHDAGFANSMLSKAVLEMDGVMTSLNKMTARCDAVKDNTPGFDYLRRATVAKRNLHSVIEQLDLYGRVPNRVRRLMSELEREPRGDNLRRIFREWLGLSAWRDRVIGHVEDEATRAAKAEERAWRRARGEVLENDSATLAEEDSRTPSSASYETMLALLKDHFRDTYVLGDRIFEIVMDSIPLIFDLSKDRPQDLVLFAEICERRDRQVSRELKRRGLFKGDDEFDSKRVQFLTLLGEYADDRAMKVLKQSSDATKKKLPAERLAFDVLINAADALLTDLQIIARDARPCFPRYYDVLGVFRKWYEARLTREFSERIHDSVTESELPSYEMLNMASWVANYCMAINTFYENESALFGNKENGHFPRDVVGLERLCDNLLDRYLTERCLPRIAHECRTKVDSIGLEFVQVDVSEVLVGDHGYLRTELPASIFTILTREMHVCNRHFTGERAFKVFEAFVNFTTTWFLPQHEKRLKEAETSSPEKHVERVCAWITDAYKCQTLIRELFDTSAEGFMRCEDVASVIGKASDVADEACNLFSESGLRFAKEDIVEKRILADIESHVFVNMFSKEWEESLYLGARVITATFEDWFFHDTNGLIEWISNDLVLGRALLMCLEGTVKRYANGLLQWKNKFGSAKRAAGRVEEDAKLVALFFKRQIPILKMANSASCRTEEDVEKKFRLLHLLSDVLQGDEFNLDPLLETLGSAHATRVVVKRLRALRGGRVFNRREADLDKDLAEPFNAPGAIASHIVDIPALESLGTKVGEFEGELAAASFVESSPPVVSTDRQLAFVKKISAFAKSASFQQSKPVTSTASNAASKKANGGNSAAAASGGKGPGDSPATNVLSMSEFIAPSRRN